MLVVCNGAIKSGSTWLYNILACLRPFSPPPSKYLTSINPRHPCIRPDKLDEFLSIEARVTVDYLSKNHIADPVLRDLLVANANVYVFDIERDPKDVTVSHYYHECFRNGYSGSFEDFYWSTGRKVAASLGAYHALWRDAGPRVYISSYERLHEECENEVQRIASVLGQSLTPDEASAVRDKTSLDRLRKDYENEPGFQGKKFFRKGSIGDWKNHFSDEMLEDIIRVQQRGISRLDVPARRRWWRSLWRL